MAAVRLGAVRPILAPWIQCRYKSNFNVKHPKTHYKRKIFEEVTKPIYPKQLIDRTKSCSYLKKESLLQEEEEDLFEKFKRRKCREVFEKYPTCIVFQLQSIKALERRKIQNALFKNDFLMYQYSPRILRESLTRSKWINLFPLLDQNNVYIFAEHTKISDLLKVTKKMAPMILLGGVVENRILTKEGLTRYESSPGIEAVRGELCAILNSGAAKTRSLLGSQQQTLSRNLEQYLKQNKDVKPEL